MEFFQINIFVLLDKICKIYKRGTHLGFNAIKMLKKISLAPLTQVET